MSEQRCGKVSFKYWVGCFGLLLMMASSSMRAESGLNGVAVYSELGSELFIAALYSGQTGTNAQELINGSYTKRIELKVLSQQGIAVRQFNRIWFESVTINNAQDVLIAHADNMVYFQALIRDRLESNDHLVIGYAPGEGVSVSLNRVLLGHIKDDAFFGVLLQSWIGHIPPSSKFRADLLMANAADDALVNRFINMYPRDARIKIVKRWLQPTVPAAAMTPPVVAAAQKPLQENVPTTAPAVVSPPVIDDAKTSNAAATPTVVAVEESVVALATNPVTDVGATEQSLSDAQVLLAKQFYIADVFRKVYAQVDYPRRARELQQKGTVKLSVVIDSVGNIKALAPIDESKFMLLNKAAIAAVNKAAPFSPLPQGINVTELELSLPITFSLGES
jgi:protein TonB